MQGASSSGAGAGGVSVGGNSQNNPAGGDGPVQPKPAGQGDSRTAGSDADSAAKAQALKNDPWFSKLPPELRDAIQSKTRNRPPRGYEERLRRYFESND
jgi:hypothetical protein